VPNAQSKQRGNSAFPESFNWTQRGVLTSGETGKLGGKQLRGVRCKAASAAFMSWFSCCEVLREGAASSFIKVTS
jgi:hypothetical protein